MSPLMSLITKHYLAHIHHDERTLTLYLARKYLNLLCHHSSINKTNKLSYFYNLIIPKPYK